MTRFEQIVKNCELGKKECGINQSYAYESGYYQSQVKSLLQEIDYLQQELESTIESIKDLTRDLA